MKNKKVMLLLWLLSFVVLFISLLARFEGSMSLVILQNPNVLTFIEMIILLPISVGIILYSILAFRNKEMLLFWVIIISLLSIIYPIYTFTSYFLLFRIGIYIEVIIIAIPSIISMIFTIFSIYKYKKRTKNITTN